MIISYMAYMDYDFFSSLSSPPLSYIYMYIFSALLNRYSSSQITIILISK